MGYSPLSERAPLPSAASGTTRRGRILVLVQSFPLPSETFVVDHVVGLRSHGWDVHVACLERDAPALARLGSLVADLPVHCLSSPSSSSPGWRQLARIVWSRCAPLSVTLRSSSLRQAILLRRPVSALIAEIRPDLIHAHFGPMGLVATVARSGVPVVVNFHGYDVTSLPRAEGWEPYRLAFGGVTLVAHSAFVETLLRKHVSSNVHRVPLGVDSSRFFAPARRPDGWPACLRLLTVGRLVFQKGHHLAIETLAMLRRSRSPVPARLTICGGGPEDARLRRHSRMLGVEEDVVFTGPVSHEEVAGCMREADVLLVPSVRDAAGCEEAFCRVAIEGMASGLLVIGTDVGGLSETISTGGVVVSSGDAAAMTDALRIAICQNTRSAVAERAGRRAADFPILGMQEAYDLLASQTRSR